MPGSVVVSRDGARVFVTGSAGTIAYNARTGARPWAVATDVFAGSLSDLAPTAAAGPDGTTLFVAGSAGEPSDYTTFAYSSATGKQLWVKRYNGPANGSDVPHAVAVSPDGATVYVHGVSKRSTEWDITTVAYDASSGAQRWVARYPGPGSTEPDDVAATLPAPQSLAVSPDSATVFVTGSSRGYLTGLDYATVAYNAKSGATLWARRYNYRQGGDIAFAVTVNPRGDTVFVTGGSQGAAYYLDFATVAYSAATGTQRWASRYDGPAKLSDTGGRIVVTPSGDKLVINGISETTRDAVDLTTIGYRTATGEQLWVQRHEATTGLTAGVGLSSDGTRVYVAGAGRDRREYATLAYATASGEQLWITRYLYGQARALAVSPQGAVFVTGSMNDGYTTVAYRG